MIRNLVEFALRSPWLIFLLSLGLIAAGLLSFRALDIEAYPNPAPPMVELVAQPHGSSAEEVERYVTVPLEIGLSGMLGIEHIRSQSLFGLSDVKCYFNWGTRYADARQEVINRLQFIQLPNAVQASISPWNAIGELYRYRLQGDGYSVLELKTAEDWILERQFKQVPGVIDVVSFGGETKQYHIDVDPFRLRAQGLTLQQLEEAVGRSNRNVGGQRLTIGEQAYAVRGIGLLRDVHDIDNIVLDAHNGVPIRVGNIGTSSVSFAPRLGIVGKDREPDIVEGIVLMRYGGETSPTLRGIHAKAKEIERQHLLPPGMRILPFLDRGDLVNITTHTVFKNVLIGMGLVTLVLLLFLGNGRAALVTAVNIPLSLLIAFIGMVASGTPANLISLGAVDFGIVVESTVIMMENISRQLVREQGGTIIERITASAREVGGPMLFSTLIIAAAFMPLFTMTGVSGVIFAPMAHTYAFAVGGAIVLALSLTPALASKVLRPGTEEREIRIMQWLRAVYEPLASAAIHRPWYVAAASVLPVVFALIAFPWLGGEFLPRLEEGNFWIRATLPTSISLDQSAKYVGRMRDIIRGCPSDEHQVCTSATQRHPEVLTVVSQLGRPDDGTDVSGFYNIELLAPLLPLGQWKHGLTKDKLGEQLSRELHGAFPGVVFNFSQAISDNVDEALSGIKGENSVKVFGPDIASNERKANQIVRILSHVRGITDLGLFSSLGQPNLKITIDRRACSRYGLNTGDVDAVIEAAVGGQAITQVYEGEKLFDLIIRWQEPFRDTVEAIRQITVPTPDGKHIPLAELASISKEDGPSVIYREDVKRYSPVKFSVRNRDLQSTVLEAQRRVVANVKLPYEIHLEWAGQMGELKSALGRLSVIVPATLLVIALLVFAAVRGWMETGIVVASIPLACSGGVIALLLTRTALSVSAAMGFVSIFGIAIQDAILVVTYFQRFRASGLSVEQAADQAAEKGFRPCLMTTLVATLGLLPAAISTEIGAQTQRPLAVVVIGGALILALTTRVVKPALLVALQRWLTAPAVRSEAK